MTSHQHTRRARTAEGSGARMNRDQRIAAAAMNVHAPAPAVSAPKARKSHGARPQPRVHRTSYNPVVWHTEAEEQIGEVGRNVSRAGFLLLAVIIGINHMLLPWLPILIGTQIAFDFAVYYFESRKNRNDS